MSLQQDTLQIKQHLRLLFSEDAIIEVVTSSNGRAADIGRRLPGIEAAAEAAMNRNPVWVGINPVTPGEGRASDRHVKRRRALVVDIDALGPDGQARASGSSAEPEQLSDAKEIKDRVISVLSSTMPAPLCVIFTGNGYQIFWRCDLDVESDRPRALVESLANLFGPSIDTSVHSAAQLVRLAGTVNVKGDTPRLAQVEFANEGSPVLYEDDLSTFQCAPRSSVDDLEDEEIEAWRRRLIARGGGLVLNDVATRRPSGIFIGVATCLACSGDNTRRDGTGCGVLLKGEDQARFLCSHQNSCPLNNGPQGPQGKAVFSRWFYEKQTMENALDPSLAAATLIEQAEKLGFEVKPQASSLGGHLARAADEIEKRYRRAVRQCRVFWWSVEDNATVEVTLVNGFIREWLMVDEFFGAMEKPAGFLTRVRRTIERRVVWSREDREPFQGDDVARRLWRIESAQFAIEPVAGPCPMWEATMAHMFASLTISPGVCSCGQVIGSNKTYTCEGCGERLDLLERGAAWCHYHKLTGVDWGWQWLAGMVQRPRLRAPGISFVGPRGCGKTTFMEKVIDLLVGGVCDPTKYLQGRTRFNGDMSGAVLGHVDEAKITAVDRYKELITNRTVAVEGKGRQAAKEPSYLRMVQTCNTLGRTLVDAEDARSVVIMVKSLTRGDPHEWHRLMDEQAPAALAKLLALQLVESWDRLTPMLVDSSARQRAVQTNETAWARWLALEENQRLLVAQGVSTAVVEYRQGAGLTFVERNVPTSDLADSVPEGLSWAADLWAVVREKALAAKGKGFTLGEECKALGWNGKGRESQAARRALVRLGVTAPAGRGSHGALYKIGPKVNKRKGLFR